uniref:BTB domain-containing protein n=1 Tax=Anopheles dirus TaxID=7168 RepID=A0A182NNA0_9DIPT
MFGTWTNPNVTLPPDVILEVGPHPCSIRFAAHAALLATHSGYLRAALRTLEQQHAANPNGTLRRALQQHTNAAGINATPETCSFPAATTTSLLYLPNITTEQFTPLLSYMYTGYLDLTMDNIFGVLLATHLLHMPRALELCRTYLSAPTASNASPCTSISGEHLQRNYYHTKPDASETTTFSTVNGPTRLVRPIASKAMATMGLNFIAPPTASSQINLLPSAPFRSLGSTSQVIASEIAATEEVLRRENHSPSQSPISVTRYEEESIPPLTPQGSSVIESDTADINIDLKCDASEPKHNDSVKRTQDGPESPPTVDNGNRSIKYSSNGLLQIAPAKRHKSQTDLANDGTNGVIIDIASCDGPVRFRRVLNVMYGCNTNSGTPACTDAPIEDESCTAETENSVKKKHTRSLRYASSFHQQMARNISNTGKLIYESSSSSSNSSYQKFHHLQTQLLSKTQLQPETQQNLSQDHEQKDENSQEDSIAYDAEPPTGTDGNSSYTCVYCKHTFKSHYCYQKHAKRHLIPLRLDNNRSTASCSGTSLKYGFHTAGHAKAFDAARRRSQASSSVGNSNTVKREVKPLDMNVQYYPCKTCGSKFPSYYFVHKHRKLCHTEEDENSINISADKTSHTTTPAEIPKTDDAVNVLGTEPAPDATSEQRKDLF